MQTKIAELIHAHERFEIITHEGPDADAVGSSRALGFALSSLGKSFRLVYPSPIPDSLLFSPAPKEEKYLTPEVSLIVDVSDEGLLGVVRPQGRMAVIDHHRTNTGYGEVSWVDPDRSSACEMVRELIDVLGINMTQAMATNLYMGLFGDTGGFIHHNTNAAVFDLAADLTRHGADPNCIAYKLRRNRSLVYFQLLCLAMDRLTIEDGVYVSYLTCDDMVCMKARAEDTTGIIEEIASLANAELCVLIKELNPDEVHCSMRSKRSDSALRTARAFGGGGHRNAAGFTQRAQARDLVDDVIEEGLKWVHKG